MCSIFLVVGMLGTFRFLDIMKGKLWRLWFMLFYPDESYFFSFSFKKNSSFHSSFSLLKRACIFVGVQLQRTLPCSALPSSAELLCLLQGCCGFAPRTCDIGVGRDGGRQSVGSLPQHVCFPCPQALMSLEGQHVISQHPQRPIGHADCLALIWKLWKWNVIPHNSPPTGVASRHHLPASVHSQCLQIVVFYFSWESFVFCSEFPATTCGGRKVVR